MSFIQFHVLRTLPFSNPNRDDAGRPKTGTMGGVPRLRLSSQSIKRAMRDHAIYKRSLPGVECFRTRHIPNMFAKRLLEDGVEPQTVLQLVTMLVGNLMALVIKAPSKAKAADAADAQAEAGGEAKKGKKDKKDKAAQTYGTEEELLAALADVSSKELVYMAQDELDRLVDFAKFFSASYANLSAVTDVQLKQALKGLVSEVFTGTSMAINIALFGRMLATIGQIDGNRNVDGAIQVSHAVTTHQALPEEDYFSGLDDLNANAGIIESQGYGSGTYYTYYCLDVEQLKRNLSGEITNAEMAKAVEGLLMSIIETVPTGKTSSFAHRTFPFYVRVEVGDRANRSLADAFTDPVPLENVQANSIKRIDEYIDIQNDLYGITPEDLEARTLRHGDPDSDSIRELVAHVTKLFV